MSTQRCITTPNVSVVIIWVAVYTLIFHKKILNSGIGFKPRNGIILNHWWRQIRKFWFEHPTYFATAIHTEKKVPISTFKEENLSYKIFPFKGSRIHLLKRFSKISTFAPSVPIKEPDESSFREGYWNKILLRNSKSVPSLKVPARDSI